MQEMVLAFVALAALVSWPMTLLMRALGRRVGALDGAGVQGQVKAPARRVPNTGGVAIFAGVAGPMLAGLIAVHTPLAEAVVSLVPALDEFLPGVRATTGDAVALLLAVSALHVTGLIDDRRPLGPFLKLGVMLTAALVVVLVTDSRLLVLLDRFAGGTWASVLLTVLWIAVVTNAMNFMDNMDGLSAGVGAIAASCFLAAAMTHSPPQWFVAVMLALLVGALMGFLCFNFPWRARAAASDRSGLGPTEPGATIFMGDGGSLVVGFLLAFLTVRTTYYSPGAAGGWYGVFMPLVVLAVPIYDFVSVSAIRISQGRSPLVGDLQHFSHRLVRRGLSKRDAVLVIYGLTGITAIGGISLASLQDWQAILVGVQTTLVLLLIALYERRAELPTTGGA